jgi:hypothetical protein
MQPALFKLLAPIFVGLTEDPVLGLGTVVQGLAAERENPSFFLFQWFDLVGFSRI